MTDPSPHSPRRARRRARRLVTITAIVLLATLGIADAAEELHIHVGNLIVEGEGGFSPQALPRHRDAPITLHGGGSISTADGSLPPILEELTILFDRHGAVVTEGLERCTRGELLATTVARARAACPKAIVGEGAGTAVIKFPEQPGFKVSSPITIFNGPPSHGDPTVLAHAYLSVPAPTTYIVPIVIEPIHDGVFGYRTRAKIPQIAGGAGIPLSGHLRIGRRWTDRGRRLSYVNARCETGKLEAKGEFHFSDGTFLEGTFFRPCQVRP